MEPNTKTSSPNDQSLDKPKANLESFLESFHKDLWRHVLIPMLDKEDLSALALTSKKLKKKVSIFLNIAWEKRCSEITINADSWKNLGVKITHVPKLPKNIDAILKSDCPYFTNKKVCQTHKLVLMPGGLSINGQAALMMHLRQENKEGDYTLLWDGISKELADKKILDPYWILITKEVIPNSRYQSFEKQNELVGKGKGYQAPSVLEAITLVTMENTCFNKQEEFLLPGTFTRCAEKIRNWQISVGAFSLSGLQVNNYSGGHRSTGILGVRRLTPTV